ASGSFSLPDLTLFQNGFGNIIIGRSGGTGAVDVRASLFTDPVLIRGGALTLNGALTGTGNASISLLGTSIALNNGITTSGQGITLTGPTTLGASVALNTGTGTGNITVNGALDGSTVNGQNLTLTAGLGDISLGGIIGGTAALGNILITT